MSSFLAAYSALANIEVIAHRGMHQVLKQDQPILWDQCTANIIKKSNHNYIENSIDSMKKAYKLGATLVEIDIHLTKDNKIVVFHDFDLNCRTNSKELGCKEVEWSGKNRCLIWQQKWDFIKTLDMGYGYTWDQGKTYPFRGKFVGKIPLLSEVLSVLGKHKFLIHHKGDEGDTLKYAAEIIKGFPLSVRKNLLWYGLDAKKRRQLKELLPYSSVFMFTKKDIKKCGLWFLTTGLIGWVPSQCKGVLMAAPLRYFRKLGFLRGYIVDRIHGANSKIMIADIESLEDFEEIKPYTIDAIWTNHIEIIGPLIKSKRLNH